jgi:hypothetical protein
MSLEIAPFKVVKKLGMLMVEKDIEITGVFTEMFELEDFPFDC